MKTYLLHSIGKYKRFNDHLEIKTIICNKPWRIFNDSGEKEVYIFQDNGELLISFNGEITDASWSYISANKSIRISTSEKSYMLRPFFLDGVIFSLQLDGTDKYTFMINENSQDQALIQTLEDIRVKMEKSSESRSQERQSKINNDQCLSDKELAKELAYQDKEYIKLISKEDNYLIVSIFMVIALFIIPLITYIMADDEVAVIIAVLFSLFLIAVPIKLISQCRRKRNQIIDNYLTNIGVRDKLTTN